MKAVSTFVAIFALVSRKIRPFSSANCHGSTSEQGQKKVRYCVANWANQQARLEKGTILWRELDESTSTGQEKVLVHTRVVNWSKSTRKGQEKDTTRGVFSKAF